MNIAMILQNELPSVAYPVLSVYTLQ